MKYSFSFRQRDIVISFLELNCTGSDMVGLLATAGDTLGAAAITAQSQQPWFVHPGTTFSAVEGLALGLFSSSSPWVYLNYLVPPPKKALPVFSWQHEKSWRVDAAQSLSWDQTPDVIKVINVFQVMFCLLLKASAKFCRRVFIKCCRCLIQYKR